MGFRTAESFRGDALVNPGTYPGIDDDVFNALRGMGYRGAMDDMAHAYLGDLGLTGSTQERLLKHATNLIYKDSLNVTRAGANATYTDKDGVLQTASANTPRYDHGPCAITAQNLQAYSENFSGSGWTLGGSASLESDAEISPDAIQNADVLTTAVSNDSVTYTNTHLKPNTTYVACVYRKLLTGDPGNFEIRLTVHGAGLTANKSTSMHTGTRDWKRFSVEFTTGATPTNGANFQVRGEIAQTVAIYGAHIRELVNPDTYVKTEAVPVTTYEHPFRGLLVEPAATNLVTYSSDLNNAAWTKGAGSAITNDAGVSPSGATDADLWNGTTSVQCTEYAASASTTYTHSFYVKAGTATTMDFSGQARPAFNSTANCTVDLLSETVTAGAGTATMTSVGDGWFRVTCTAATPGGTTGIVNIFNSADGSVYIWGVQSEVGPLYTSYVATTSAAATRNADVPTLTDLTWLNGSRGTFVVEFESGGYLGDNSERVFELQSDANNLIHIAGTGTAGNMVASASTGGVTQFSFADTWAASTHKAVLSYQANDIRYSLDGAALDTDTVATIPTVSALALGNRPAGDRGLGGWISYFAYYGSVPTDAWIISESS